MSHSCISQGCPLSPFLFSMVMTVLMTDARATLTHGAREACKTGELEDVLFADDTLLIGSHGPFVEEYMCAVETAGMDYGLQIHWGKVHVVAVGRCSKIHSPSQKEIKPQASMMYLGSTIHTDGKFGCEVSREIGAARAEFRSLSHVWRSRSVTRGRKLELFNTYIISKLRYGITSAWLAKADWRRLDGFQARCLREILRIPPAFVSRVSNERVRATAGHEAFSTSTSRAQLNFLEKVLGDPAKRTLRDAAFLPGTERSLTTVHARKKGRPRHSWTDQLLAIRSKCE